VSFWSVIRKRISEERRGRVREARTVLVVGFAEGGGRVLLLVEEFVELLRD
jgi:hypothetical protein